VQFLAAVALNGHSRFLLPAYDALGADHGAHPAAHTLLFLAVDYSCDGVLDQGSGTADCDTGCIRAVAADQWHILTIRLLHIKTAYG